jgi:cell filamentation protein, protein adenylyltransferase
MVRCRPCRTRTCSSTCYVRKEAVLSSQIEGTQSSLQDLLAAEAHILGEGRPRDVDEVVNYVGAMKHGLARLADVPVSVRLIREIHAELLTGVRGSRTHPGRTAPQSELDRSGRLHAR